MEEIEKATSKKIIRIETNDLDEMEEVSLIFLRVVYPSFHAAHHLHIRHRYQNTRPHSHEPTFFPPLILYSPHTTRVSPSFRILALTALTDLFWTSAANEESFEVKSVIN